VTARAGEPFDAARALSAVDAALSAALPATGPPADEGDPVTGEWAATRGEGFLLLPLWESAGLTGVYGREWNEAEASAEAHLAALVSGLDARWGSHRTVSMRVPVLRRGTGDPLPEPFRTLAAKDCYGDLKTWGPLPASPSPRWVALSLNQSDGDAPFVLTALLTDRPLTEPTEQHGS
jgi:hypothetical protein